MARFSSPRALMTYSDLQGAVGSRSQRRSANRPPSIVERRLRLSGVGARNAQAFRNTTLPGSRIGALRAPALTTCAARGLAAGKRSRGMQTMNAIAPAAPINRTASRFCLINGIQLAPLLDQLRTEGELPWVKGRAHRIRIPLYRQKAALACALATEERTQCPSKIPENRQGTTTIRGHRPGTCTLTKATGHKASTGKQTRSGIRPRARSSSVVRMAKPKTLTFAEAALAKKARRRGDSSYNLELFRARL